MTIFWFDLIDRYLEAFFFIPCKGWTGDSATWHFFWIDLALLLMQLHSFIHPSIHSCLVWSGLICKKRCHGQCTYFCCKLWLTRKSQKVSLSLSLSLSMGAPSDPEHLRIHPLRVTSIYSTSRVWIGNMSLQCIDNNGCLRRQSNSNSLTKTTKWIQLGKQVQCLAHGIQTYVVTGNIRVNSK